MAKKRTKCIGWTKGFQRMDSNILKIAPVIGAEEAGKLLSNLTAAHKSRVAAIMARA